MNYFPESDIEIVKEWLTQHPKVTIVTHHNPDGDAIGSSIALMHFLNQRGLEATCLFPSDIPPYYHWVPEVDKALVYQDKTRKKFEPFFDEDRLIFCLDFNVSTRTGGFSYLLAQSKAKKILIDHHEEPSDEFNINFSYPGKSSTCELIYDFIIRIDPTQLNLAIANCLYTGLITDTGGFQFSSTHPSTHLMAARLIELGVQPNTIYNLAFNNFSLNRLRMFGYCISQNMKVFEDKKLAYLWIDKKTKRKFNIQDGDTEGLVSYPLKVLDIDIAVLFKEDINKIRISFRSKDNTDVSHIAKQYFLGGGHKNAAGGLSKISLEETLAYFESLIPSIF